jgi:hypothetical protein
MANSLYNPFLINTTYNPGDYVTYAGKLYSAKIVTTGISPLNNTNWLLVSSSFSYSGTWSSNTTYQISKYVIYNKNTYLSLQANNVGNNPESSINYWRIINSKYNTIVTTQPGDLQYQGNTGPVRIPIGNAYQVLSVTNGNIGWIDSSALPSSSNVTSNTVISNTVTSNTVISNTVTTNKVTSNTVTSNTLVSNNFTYSNGESVGFIYTLDNISSYFDGISTSFSLTYNGIPIAPNNPNQVQVEIGNISIYPNNRSEDYFNHVSEIYTQQNGFTLNGNVITFATAPMNGMGFYGTYKTSSDKLPPFYFYQLPFSPLNIMLN